MKSTLRINQSGLSLLEMLVAFAILAFSLGALYQADASNLRNMGDAERYERALALAQSVLDMRDAVPADGWNEAGESAGYAWAVRSAPFATAVTALTVPRLHQVSITVSWTAAGSARQVDVATLRPQRKALGAAAL